VIAGGNVEVGDVLADVTVFDTVRVTVAFDAPPFVGYATAVRECEPLVKLVVSRPPVLPPNR
jgi:hypothetical protein